MRFPLYDGDMTMRAATALLLLPLFVQAALAKQPSPPPSWFPATVALADDHAVDALTTATLPALLHGLATVSIDTDCRLDQGPTDAAQIMAILPGTDCSVPAPVTSVQLQLNATPGQIAALTREIRASRGAPCFQGPYQPNPRRRAPPTNLAVWSTTRRDFVLSWDAAAPGLLSVALIDKVQHPTAAADQARYTGFLAAAADGLPPSCRATP